MPNSNERLSIRVADTETIEIEASPLMLLSFIDELLSLAEGDPEPEHVWDDLLMPGVQLDDDSEDILLIRVGDSYSHARLNTPKSPAKLEPLRFIVEHSGYHLQLTASKDGLIHLSRELMRILTFKPTVSHLTPDKELGADSLAVRVVLLPNGGPEVGARS